MVFAETRILSKKLLVVLASTVYQIYLCESDDIYAIDVFPLNVGRKSYTKKINIYKTNRSLAVFQKVKLIIHFFLNVFFSPDKDLRRLYITYLPIRHSPNVQFWVVNLHVGRQRHFCPQKACNNLEPIKPKETHRKPRNPTQQEFLFGFLPALSVMRRTS
jgi:hypothetical protein